MKKMFVTGMILLGMNQTTWSMQMGDSRTFNGPSACCKTSCWDCDDDTAVALCCQDFGLCCDKIDDAAARLLKACFTTVKKGESQKKQ